LTPIVVYKPARTGDRIGYVVGQFPREGTASAYDRITLVSEKSLHGVVPRVVGLPVDRAQARLARLHLKVRVVGRGKVAAQSPRPGTAAAPGLAITLTARP
jgi:beta-lactam-binding protein with PASTA domain